MAPKASSKAMQQTMEQRKADLIADRDDEEKAEKIERISPTKLKVTFAWRHKGVARSTPGTVKTFTLDFANVDEDTKQRIMLSNGLAVKMQTLLRNNDEYAQEDSFDVAELWKHARRGGGRIPVNPVSVAEKELAKLEAAGFKLTPTQRAAYLKPAQEAWAAKEAAREAAKPQSATVTPLTQTAAKSRRGK